MKIFERDIDSAIVHNLKQSSSFRDWFVIKLTQLPVFPYEFLEARRSVRDPKLGETDIFFKIRVLNPEWNKTIKFLWEQKYLSSFRYSPSYEWSSVVAFLIENKIDAGDQPEQPLRYEARGLQGIEQKQWGYFRCGLVAPKSYVDYTTQTMLEYPRQRWGKVRELSYSRIIYYEKLVDQLQKNSASQDQIEMFAAAITKANRRFLPP